MVSVSRLAPLEETLDFGFEYPPGNPCEFTLEEIRLIQAGYLEEHLKLLTDARASAESIQDVHEWLMTPLVPEEDEEQLAILSFQRCCYAYGVDPAITQESFMRRIAPERLAEFGYE